MSDNIPFSFANSRMRCYLENDATVSPEFNAFLWVDTFVMRFKERRMSPTIPYRSYVTVDDESLDLEKRKVTVVNALFDPLDGDPSIYWPRYVKSRVEMEAHLFLCDHHVHNLCHNEFVFVDDCPELGEGHLCVRPRPGMTLKLPQVKSAITGILEHFGHHDFITLIGMGLPIAFQDNSYSDEARGEGSAMFGGLLPYMNFGGDMLEYTDRERISETLFSKSASRVFRYSFPSQRFEGERYEDCGSLKTPFSKWPKTATFKSDLPPFHGVLLKGVGNKSKTFEWTDKMQITIKYPFDEGASVEERISDSINSILQRMDSRLSKDKRVKRRGGDSFEYLTQEAEDAQMQKPRKGKKQQQKGGKKSKKQVADEDGSVSSGNSMNTRKMSRYDNILKQVEEAAAVQNREREESDLDSGSDVERDSDNNYDNNDNDNNNYNNNFEDDIYYYQSDSSPIPQKTEVIDLTGDSPVDVPRLDNNGVADLEEEWTQKQQQDQNSSDDEELVERQQEVDSISGVTDFEQVTNPTTTTTTTTLLTTTTKQKSPVSIGSSPNKKRKSIKILRLQSTAARLEREKNSNDN